MSTTRHMRIAGRVQGVGYRDALRRQALAHGLAGWVRNRHDGSVEAVLQGDAGSIQAVVDWARYGPPAARVERIEEGPAEADADRCYSGFERLPTC